MSAAQPLPMPPLSRRIPGLPTNGPLFAVGHGASPALLGIGACRRALRRGCERLGEGSRRRPSARTRIAQRLEMIDHRRIDEPIAALSCRDGGLDKAEHQLTCRNDRTRVAIEPRQLAARSKARQLAMHDPHANVDLDRGQLRRQYVRPIGRADQQSHVRAEEIEFPLDLDEHLKMSSSGPEPGAVRGPARPTAARPRAAL